MFPLPSLLTIPLDVCFTFASCRKLLIADEVRYVNSGGVGKSGTLRCFKILKYVPNLIAEGPFRL
jgi:hypothetical protein